LGEFKRTERVTFGVVAALILSIGWIVAGYALGLAESMKTVGFSLGLVIFVCVATLINLILVPFCLREKELGFFFALIVGVLAIVLEIAIGPVASLIGSGWQSTYDFSLVIGGGLIWLIIQIPVVVFSVLAYRKSLLNKKV
jgi:hypothetical protein